MRNRLFRIGIFLLIGLLFMGCKDQPVEHLLGANKAWNPYIGNETLVFQDSVGDSLVFIGQGRHTYTYEYEPSGTPYGYWINESDVGTFVDTQDKYSFEIRLGSHAGNGFSMSFWFCSTFGYIPISCCYYTPDLHSYYSVTSEYPPAYIDSMEVLNTMYYNAILDSTYWGEYGQNNCEKFIKQTFYTKENGFIRIDFEDGRSFGLSSIISD